MRTDMYFCYCYEIIISIYPFQLWLSSKLFHDTLTVFVSRKLFVYLPKTCKQYIGCVTSFHLLNLLFNSHCVALNWAGISLLQYGYLRLWPDTRILLLSDWHHHTVLVPEHAGGPNRICSLHRNASVMISWSSMLIIQYDKIMKTVKHHMWWDFRICSVYQEKS